MDELLPLVPEGASQISNILSVIQEKDKWTYFYGSFPVFSHAASDRAAFRMISSSFINTGICRNIDIENVFHVSKRSIIRNCHRYSEFGAEGFIGRVKGKGKRKGNVFTCSKIKRAEELLSAGFSRSETADKIGVKYSTLSKAIQAGRIKYIKPDENCCTDKSARSIQDTQAGEVLGVACTNLIDRTLCAFGLSGVVESNFEHCNDVKNGGILTALPFLAANGLFHKTEECFGEFKGYYSVLHILTLLAFMALCRIKTVEKLRWESPGEFGKLLGLDRIAEVRCLRNKLGALSCNDAAVKWGEILGRKWMEEEPELAGVLYVDGHVRLYGGKEKLPKQFVSRQKLCLKGVMDFWVNDMFGRPFFVIRKDINPGMLKVLRNDIVPRLLEEVPNQPSEEMLKNDPYVYRFILVFDREGYSPEFFKDMWTEHRIACITYNKYPKEDWKKEEFKEETVNLISGEKTVMKLAERGTYIGNNKKGTWVHEIRKLTKSGHQTSIITTAFSLSIRLIAVLMFARWCQENFFNYMMKHFAIDLLSDYQKKEVDVTESVVSPKWRGLEKKINSLLGKLKTRKSRFADLTLNPILENDEKNYKEWVDTKTELAEEITLFEKQISIKKEEQKNNEKHIKVVELPDEDAFKALSSSKKHLVDTVKMISYRAETAMASLLYEQCKSFEQARALLREVFVTEADLIPDKEKKNLLVRIHNLPTKAMDRRLDYLIEILNLAKMKYPGTNMLLKYQRLGI
ncbi:MAG: hypothetical protein U9Q21_02815 [Candidatus Auribacterota bacterium]|nr:hypothetical protein [Candidatus Auribacterota bacterium]